MKRVIFHIFLDHTIHKENQYRNLLNSDLIMFFRLHSYGSSLVLRGSGFGKPFSLNPHSQSDTMTIIQTLQLLIQRKNSRSKTTQGRRPHFHLLPSLPNCLFPLLSTQSFLWGNTFPPPLLSGYWKELALSEVAFMELKWHCDSTDCSLYENVFSFFLFLPHF